MGNKSREIVWTNSALNDLHDIYQYIAKRSVSSANKLIDKIANAPETIARIGFSEAFAIDEFNKKYRTIVSGNYKILYREINNKIVIFRIFDTRQNPRKLKKM